jgi:hypothetical protein
MRRYHDEKILWASCLPPAVHLYSRHSRALYRRAGVWRVQLISVKSTQMDAYLTSLSQSTKPLLYEMKRQGTIIDYKVFFARRPGTILTIGTSA